MWCRGYYRVGGTVIHGGRLLHITSLSVSEYQTGSSIFDRRDVLIVKTKEGRTLKIPDDSR